MPSSPRHLLAVTLLASTLHSQRPLSENQTALPVTRVSLYKNGVGFFEHAGTVTGNATVSIAFTTAQLNDVLQSLTAIDLGGGRIAGAGYNSTTPIEQQLKALPLGLGQDADSQAFYNAIRGARVEVRSGAIAITGRLLNLEIRTASVKDGDPAGTERRFLTVVSDAGSVRTVELTSATEVRLLDPALHTDVTRYLQLLADTRNQGLRRLTLQDNGVGQRDLRVSYISEVPAGSPPTASSSPASPPSRPSKRPRSRAGPSSTTPRGQTGSTSSFRSSQGLRRASSSRSAFRTTRGGLRFRCRRKRS